MSNKQHIVVLTGAGVSAESGLKTFRDGDGLWEGQDVNEVATPEAWSRNPAFVLDFYNLRRRQAIAAQPNEAHRLLAKLEACYRVTIVTQNVDDLHERAGSSHVLHLHGEITKARSERDESMLVDVAGDMRMGDTAPDGAQLRPHVVWFGEAVPMLEAAADMMAAADIFILIGSSLQVYPAAGLIHHVPDPIPKYVIDRVIPPVDGIPNLVKIEKTATEGMRWVFDLLQGQREGGSQGERSCS